VNLQSRKFVKLCVASGTSLTGRKSLWVIAESKWLMMLMLLILLTITSDEHYYGLLIDILKFY
jgi:hypothetical protein